MSVPLRVRILRAAVTMPPIVTLALSGRSSTADSEQSTASASAARTAFSGCAEMNSPIASFSSASSSCWSNSIEGIGGRAEATTAAGAPPLAEVEDRALADQRVLLRLLPRPLRLLEHLEHAPPRRAGRAERAALDQRLDRLLVDRAGVDALAEVPQRGERPALLARALDRLDGLEARRP